MEMTPEQQALQEKLKNMSPEELKEFQKQQCIFCQMIIGKVQAKKVYEDSLTFALLDINPANPGHILLLPKEHYAIMPQIPEEELGNIFIVAKELSHVLLRALGIEGTNILIANGVAAGQRAQHFMIHIIPRMEGDNVGLDIPRKDIDENQMEQIRQMLAESISKATGAEQPQEPIAGEQKKELIKEAKAEVEAEQENKEESSEEVEKDEAVAEEIEEGEEEVEVEGAVEEEKEKKETEEEQKQEAEKEHRNSLDMIADLLSGKDK